MIERRQGNAMVILKNLVRSQNIVECDFYAENPELNDKGHIIYDVDKKQLLERTDCPSEKDEPLKLYGERAVIRLERIINSEDFQKGIIEDMYYLHWV